MEWLAAITGIALLLTFFKKTSAVGLVAFIFLVLIWAVIALEGAL
jgi:hypothetical protein